MKKAKAFPARFDASVRRNILRAKRRRTVEKTPEEAFAQGITDCLVSRPSMLVDSTIVFDGRKTAELRKMHGDYWEHYEGNHFSVPRVFKLMYDRIKIADLTLFIRKRQNTVSAFIENIQGQDFGSSAVMRGFAEKNGKPWNLALGAAALEACYHAGVDRVLLRDVRTTPSYKDPLVFFDHFDPRSKKIPAADLEEIKRKKRSAMAQLCTRTAKDLKFTIRDGNYWVHGFP